MAGSLLCLFSVNNHEVSKLDDGGKRSPSDTSVPFSLKVLSAGWAETPGAQSFPPRARMMGRRAGQPWPLCLPPSAHSLHARPSPDEIMKTLHGISHRPAWGVATVENEETGYRKVTQERGNVAQQGHLSDLDG